MKRSGASTGALAGSLIVGLLIGAGVIYGAVSAGYIAGSTVTVSGGVSTITVTAGGGLSGNIPIGVLTDLSGQLKSEGVRVAYAAQMAANDVDAMLRAAGNTKVNFTVSIQDYALDNTKALAVMNTFKTAGIQVVVGPLNSGTAGAILQFADSNHIVLISPSSTSPALAIPNDYLFRTAPNDAAQGLADAREMAQQGVSAVIIVYRDDTYGAGLANATAARFTQLGGHVVDKIPYDTSTSDFTAVLTKMQSDYQSASSTYGAGKVAIFAITFEEIGNMLLQANSNFQTLLNTQQPWYGTDGQAEDTVLTGNSTVGPLMAKIRMDATLYSSFNSTKTQIFCNAFTSKYHQPCDSYVQGGYDDTWLAALSILAAGANSGPAIQQVLPYVANAFYGVTGWMALQPSGDRVPANGYDIWKVVLQNNTPTWILAGHWDQTSDKVTWAIPNP